MSRVLRAVALCAALAAGASAKVLGGLNSEAVDAAIKQARLGSEPSTVSTLNVTSFLGRWYEVLQDWSTANTFQKDSFCATADYFADPADAGRILVSNREHYGSITGPERNVSGYGYQPNAAAYPGRLVVYLHGQNASPFPAPYWILRTGPVINGVYDYAIVSDDFRLTLFVLARDVDRFNSVYKAELLTWLAENGFTEFWNKPMVLTQDGCTYFPPTPPS